MIHSFSSAQLKSKKVLIEGTGTPLVLLAGALAPMAAFSDISKDLSEKYRVVRMEHFNIQMAAENRLLPLNYSIETEGKGIKYTLDSLGIIEPVILVGSSYGGLMAMDFAIRNPKRTKALIILEPPAFALIINENIEGLQRTLEVTKNFTPQATITEQDVEAFRCLSINCDSIKIRTLSQWKGWVEQKNRLRGLAGTNKLNKKKIRKFNKPVLIVTGTETNAVHKRINIVLEQQFKNSKQVFIKSGHAIPSTAPKELVRLIFQFLN